MTKCRENFERTRYLLKNFKGIEKFKSVTSNKIKVIDATEKHNKMFDRNERISYYLGNLNNKKMFVKVYDYKFGKDTYIINTLFLDNDYNNEYLKDMIVYYKNFLREFPFYKENQIVFRSGDISDTSKVVPYVSKSRPCGVYGFNVLLPLNNINHWRPVANIKLYDIPYDSKKNVVVWRGSSTGNKRENFVEKYYNYPGHELNVGFTFFTNGYRGARNPRYLKRAMPIAEQLQYKFIISLEGNDVATNLKWIMASNSLCIRPKSTCSSWFMEDKLEPWVHYVPLREDYSDLLEIYKWCIENPESCKRIVKNANDYISRFMDGNHEFSIINQVLKGYCDNVTVF